MTQNSQARVDYMVQFTELLLIDTKTMLNDVYNKKSFTLDLATLRRRGKAEGEGFFCVTMPNLMTDFLSYLETGTFAMRSFAKQKGTVYPRFLCGLFRLAGSRNEHVSVVAFKCLQQILVSFKKLRGDYEEDILQDYEDKFLLDDDFDNDHTNEYDDLIVTWASVFCERIFKEIEDDPSLFDRRFTPRPGPGATNTPVPKPARWKISRNYEGIGDLLLEYMYVNYTYMHDDPNVRVEFLGRKKANAAISRFKFVPKTRAKPRGICLEENEMQYLQQGLKSVLYETIEKSRYVNGRINFKDQRVNGALALSASQDRMYATIDMSSASDRIFRKLVSRIFCDTPNLLNWLMKLSTRKIYLPSGKLLHTKKFAPMGSGICFPVMSVVHWTLIKSILFLSLHPDTTMDEVYVYGDDIIIPSSVYDTVVSILPRFGMKINAEKSYSVSSFRESCGVFAYKGVNVTPVFIKTLPCVNLDPDGYQSIIANEHQLIREGWQLAPELIRQSSDLTHYAIESSPALAWKRCNHDLTLENLKGVRVRWNCCTQRMEARVRTFDIIDDRDSEKTEYTASAAYLRSLLTLARDHDDTWSKQRFKFCWKWINLSDLHDEEQYLKTLDNDVFEYFGADSTSVAGERLLGLWTQIYN